MLRVLSRRTFFSATYHVRWTHQTVPLFRKAPDVRGMRAKMRDLEEKIQLENQLEFKPTTKEDDDVLPGPADEDMADPDFDALDDDLRVEDTEPRTEQQDKDEVEYAYDINKITHPGFVEWRKKNEEEAQASAKHIQTLKGSYRDADASMDDITVYLRGDKVCLSLTSELVWTGDDWQTLSLPQNSQVHLLIGEEFNFFKLTKERHLTQFSLTFDMPLKTHSNIDGKTVSTLKVNVQVDHQDKFPQLVKLFLRYKGKIIESQVRDTLNECLQDIKKLLPSHVVIHSCWNCGYSTYTPFGRSHFGGGGCFKDNPAMLDRTEVRGLFSLWAKRERYVQENDYCSSFVPRQVPQMMPEEDEFTKRRFRGEFNYGNEIPGSEPK